MGTLFTIWFALMGLYYLCVAVGRIAVRLPAFVVTIVCMPAMPFIVACRNRSTAPKKANLLVVLWSLVYLAVGVLWLAG